MRRHLSATGPADPQVVWERYAETEAWSTWSPQVRHVTPHARVRPGLCGRVDLLVFFEVLDVDEAARTWTWRARVGPVSLVLDHAVAPAVGGGSTTTLDVAGPSWAVWPYQPLIALALRRLVS